uniref:sialate O-acetylesterase-like n=1 Tax=Styela clava TaxID=7725 RepID=UPI001939E247|nr:sialate O-acetylesterase-like [Styela clava]
MKHAFGSLVIVLATIIFVNANQRILRMDKFAAKKPHQQTEVTFAFASYYQNNMVLQMEPHSAVIWGYGTPGATVNISVNVQDVYSTKVKVHSGFPDRGIWMVKIKPQPAGSTSDIQGVHDHFGRLQWILLKNLLFGEVYVCSGQSNMVFTMSMVYNSSEELKETVNYKDIRLFTVNQNFSDDPLYDISVIEESWSIPSPETVGGKDWSYFSAVCWLFGKYLYDELKIPIGLVASTWGGTPVEPWAPPEVFDVCNETSNDEIPSAYDNDGFTGYWDNSKIWNAQIHPLINMTIKGVLWYQGESNEAYHTNSYQCVFPQMIKSWRKNWYEGTMMSTDPDFPFGFVQIGDKTSTSGSFELIRWHQTADYGYVPNPEMENTFMAVAIDLPDNDSPYASVHTRDKQDVAHRLVAGALAVAYHRTMVFDGPFPQKLTENTKHEILIEYSNYQQLSVVDNNNFQICCADEKCQVTDPSDSPLWFTTPILGSTDHTITISSKKCSDDFKYAEKVRYAWELTPCEFKNCSVYNTLGFPAPPFFLDVTSK